jgi:subtilase family serine protease
MKLLRVVRPLPVLTLLFCSLPGLAQRPEPRLNGAVSEAARVVLSGSRTPRVRAAQDLGPISPDTRIPGITLVFRRSDAQEAALQDLLTAQQNTTSSEYHHWLTPESFASRFGIADADIATTESWLVSHGFQIDNVARSRDRITFSGTAAQVQAAFGTQLRHYQTEGELHVAPASDLTLPTDLASVTAAVLHLSDFRPKPNVRSQPRPHPDFTSVSTQTHYLDPKDIATMYDLNPLYQEQYSGTGQGLAVVGQSFVNTVAIGTFQGNLAQANNINTVLVPGTGVEAFSPGDEGESEIDLEYTSSIATNANIFFVYVGNNQNYDVFDALAFAITENVAPVVSISYGACELAISQNELNQDNALFEEAAAQGQTLVASAGDNGSTACAPFTSAQGVTTAEQQALSVNFPASSPYVTAVGGTQMAAGTFTAGASSYWASATTSNVVNSLLSYIPEVAWNESSATNGIAAGGGGTSAYFPRPTWQSVVPGIPTGTYRLLPDIALQSSIASPGFLLCTSDPAMVNLQGQTNSCSNGLTGSSSQFTVAGGTSFAAPIFAGFIAILNGFEHTAGQGNINPVLYSLAANPASYAAAFHDITSGTNACVAAAANCSTAGQTSYTATTGYDEATGLGSLDFNALAKAWPVTGHAAQLQPTVLTLIASPTGAAAAEAVSIQIFVEPLYIQSPSAVSLATGTVSVAMDGTVVNPSLALSQINGSQVNASATYDFVAPTTAGSHLIAVTYSGDATHAPSTATYSLPVGNVLASGGITLAAGNLTIANGSTGATQVTVTPTGGYNGRVAWSLAISGSSSLTACYAIPSLPVSTTGTTQLTIGTGAACTSVAPAERGEFRPLAQRTLASDRPQRHTSSTPATAIYAGLLICGLITGWRRRLPLSLLVVLSLTVVATSLTGCSGNNTNSSTTTTTPPVTTPPGTTANYTVTLTGKDSVNSAITASTTFTLTIN